MSNTIIKICNMALTLAGEPTITSLAESTKSARLCDLRFADVRDSVLASHPWNCATKRVSLALLETTPAFGFAYEFQLPIDYLRFIDADDPEIKFKIEGRKLLADVDTFYMRYVARPDEVGQLTELCRQAIAVRLAHEICLAITRNAERSNMLWQSYREKLSEARFADACETSGDTIRTTTHLNAHYGADEVYRPISPSS